MNFRMYLARKIERENHARSFNVSERDAQRYFRTAHSIADYARGWQDYPAGGYEACTVRGLSPEERAKRHDRYLKKEIKDAKRAVKHWKDCVENYTDVVLPFLRTRLERQYGRVPIDHWEWISCNERFQRHRDRLASARRRLATLIDKRKQEKQNAAAKT